MKEFAEYLFEFTSTPWGPVILVVHSYLESFILPVAHDFFLLAVCLGRPSWSFGFSFLSTIASVLGMITGYAIGRWGEKTFLEKWMNSEMMLSAKEKIHKYDTLAIAFACFTPVPVKVFSLIAGVVHLNFKKFVFVALISRGLRFFLIGTMIYFYGESIKQWVIDSMSWVMIFILIFMVAGTIFWKIFKKLCLKKN